MDNETAQFLQSNEGLVKRIGSNLKASMQFVKLYNCLCDACKRKVKKHPRMPLEDYCEACRNKAEFRIKKATEAIKKQEGGN